MVRGCELVKNMIGPLLISCKLRCKEIRKEKKFQDRKHDKQLDKDDFPQGPPQSHPAEAITVESVDAGQ